MKIFIIILGMSASSLGFFFNSKSESDTIGIELTADKTVNKDLDKILSETKDTAVVTIEESWEHFRKKIIEDISNYIDDMKQLLDYGKQVAADTHNKWHNITVHECDQIHCYVCVMDKPDDHSTKVCLRWNIYEDNKHVRMYHLCVNNKCALVDNFFSVRDAVCMVYPPVPALWVCLRAREMNLAKKTFKLCLYLELNVWRWPVFASRSYCIKLDNNDMPYIERWSLNDRVKFFNYR